jgi:hypothetical protein
MPHPGLRFLPGRAEPAGTENNTCVMALKMRLSAASATHGLWEGPRWVESRLATSIDDDEHRFRVGAYRVVELPLAAR